MYKYGPETQTTKITKQNQTNTGSNTSYNFWSVNITQSINGGVPITLKDRTVISEDGMIFTTFAFSQSDPYNTPITA